MYISLSLAHGHLSQDIHIWHMCLPHETLFGSQVFLMPHSLFDSYVCHIKHTLAHTLFTTRLSWNTGFGMCAPVSWYMSWIIFSLVYVSVMKHFLKLVCLLWNIFSLTQVSVSQNTLPLPHVSVSKRTIFGHYHCSVTLVYESLWCLIGWV